MTNPLLPVIIENVFDNKRFLFVKNELQKIIEKTEKETRGRTVIDAEERSNYFLKMLGQELLPLAKTIFKKDNLYSSKTVFAHYEKKNGVLLKHKDFQEDIHLIDICIYEGVPWGIVVENVEYIFNENCAVAFESGKLEHWRKPNPDPENNITGVLLCYYTELML